VPCGTCDYISPEILLAHEEALVALEMTDEGQDVNGSKSADGEHDETGGCGRETDWWSLGAMLYEMTYGVAPFFANDIRQTYLRIMDHEVRSSMIR
jgi:serine/threonine protein kinase